MRPRTDQPPASNRGSPSRLVPWDCGCGHSWQPPTQRWTHGPEGQRSLRGRATGAPHSAEREKCGEEEAGHRVGGRGDRGGGWDAAPDAGACDGEGSQVRSEEGKVLGLEPDPEATTTDSRCRDAALPAEGRGCPIGPRALRRAVRLRAAGSSRQRPPPPQMPGEGGPGPSSRAQGLGFSRVEDQGHVSKTLHPLIHRLGRRHTQKGEIHGDREPSIHTHTNPKPLGHGARRITQELGDTQTHNGDTTTHIQKRTPDTMQRLRDDTKTYVPAQSDTDTGTHTATYRTTGGTEARNGPKIHTHTHAGESDTHSQNHTCEAHEVAGAQKHGAHERRASEAGA